MSKLAGVVKIVDESLNENRFSIATREIKDFFLNDFCGVYLVRWRLIDCKKKKVKVRWQVLIFFLGKYKIDG